MSSVALFAGGNLSPGIREDRANRCVIVVFVVIGLLDAYLPALQTARSFGPLVSSLLQTAQIGIMQDLGCYRSEQELPVRAVTVRRHHDQIDLLGLRAFHDGGSRIAGHEFVPDADA
ncbi:MAG: hypothetical protein WAM39_20135 [Bryobacteraceae bacterium]